MPWKFEWRSPNLETSLSLSQAPVLCAQLQVPRKFHCLCSGSAAGSLGSHLKRWQWAVEVDALPALGLIHLSWDNSASDHHTFTVGFWSQAARLSHSMLPSVLQSSPSFLSQCIGNKNSHAENHKPWGHSLTIVIQRSWQIFGTWSIAWISK